MKQAFWLRHADWQVMDLCTAKKIYVQAKVRGYGSIELGHLIRKTIGRIFYFCYSLVYT